MPLHDHFHAPLHPRRHWESFLVTWAGSLADVLNGGLLPEDYFAEESRHLTLAADYSAAFPKDFEVLVFKNADEPKLAAAIELISPVNKDRVEHRREFALKCASYLGQGIGLIIVDIVTGQGGNLHNEVIGVLEKAKKLQLPGGVSLYAVAYRPLRREGREEIEFWPFPLALGAKLPMLPLALHAELVLPVDFEAAYSDACHRRKLP
jgi:hypothetical protein